MRNSVKKYSYCILLIVLFCTFLLGCSKSPRSLQVPSTLQTWMQENGKIKVLSTTSMIDDIVGIIGGDRIDHISLISGEIDPHSYELVKGDGEKFSRAQVVFSNGLGLEHGASVRYQLEHHTQSVAVGDYILKKYPEKILRVDGQMDPHIWMDVLLWSFIIEPISTSLIQLDPEGTAVYTANAEKLRRDLLELDGKLYEQLQQVPEHLRYLVTSHDAFNYFTRRYLALPQEILDDTWTKRFDAPEGLAPEGQLSAHDIQKIVNHLKTYDIHVVFPESNVSKDSLKKIILVCKQKGIEVNIASDVLYGDAMGLPGSGAESYEKMLAYDAEMMRREWLKYE